MEYRARISFTGSISMYQNEVRELTEDKAVSLVACGYLELVNKYEQEPLPAKKQSKSTKKNPEDKE